MNRYVVMFLLFGLFTGITVGIILGEDYTAVRMQKFAIANGCGVYSKKDASFSWVDQYAALGAALPTAAFEPEKKK